MAKVIPANSNVWASVEGTWDILTASLMADFIASGVVSGSFPELSYIPLRVSVRGGREREREEEGEGRGEREGEREEKRRELITLIVM